MLLAPLIQAVVASIIQMMMARIAVSAKAMSSEAIYRKALRLTSTAKGSTSTGQLVNIMSTDTYVLLQFVMIINIIAMNNRAAQNVLDFFAGILDEKYRLV